jgi:hypothetical protein
LERLARQRAGRSVAANKKPPAAARIAESLTQAEWLIIGAAGHAIDAASAASA